MNVKPLGYELVENQEGPRILSFEVEIRDTREPPFPTPYPHFLLQLRVKREEPLVRNLQGPIIGYFPATGTTVKRVETIKIPVPLTYEQIGLIDEHRKEGDVILQGRLEAVGWFSDSSVAGAIKLSTANLGADLIWKIAKSDWADKVLRNTVSIEITTETQVELHELMGKLNRKGYEDVIEELLGHFKRKGKPSDQFAVEESG